MELERTEYEKLFLNYFTSLSYFDLIFKRFNAVDETTTLFEAKFFKNESFLSLERFLLLLWT